MKARIAKALAEGRRAWFEYEKVCEEMRENTRLERTLGITEETPEYLRLSAEKRRARLALPGWLRWFA